MTAGTVAVGNAVPKEMSEDDAQSMQPVTLQSAPNSLADDCVTSFDDQNMRNIAPMHFCFIAHGHQGRPNDLSYLHHTVKAKAIDNENFADAKSSDSCVVGQKMMDKAASSKNNASNNGRKWRRRGKRDKLQKTNGIDHQVGSTAVGSTITTDDIENEESKSTLIVHNAACNEGKTNDGIRNGGQRLANEMLHVIRSEVDSKSAHRGPTDVTISIVGNSLGGLYGRYAVAHLAEVLGEPTQGLADESKEENCSYYLLDGHIRIHFNVFCSTASPHLGCASHTFFRIPRMAEIGVAQVLGETGSDLFRTNELLQTMAISPRFLKPLASFRRRIAYANAYAANSQFM